LAAGQGAGDFDSRLVFVSGPDRAGEQVLIGGVVDIEIGKLPGSHVHITGQRVSRLHCRLKRLDFGPSRWTIEDNHSTNGLFVNGQRVSGHELKDGDVVQVGEYALRYASDAARPAVVPGVPVKAIPVGGPTCPSCERPLYDGALICTDCGIYVHSGRPLVTARGIDQDRVDEVAREAIWLPSWLLLMGFIPVASEAFGTHKPRATWCILAITVLCSFLFFGASYTGAGTSPAAQNLMAWSGDRGLTEPKVRDSLDELKKLDDDLEAEKDRIPAYYLRRLRRQIARKRADLAPLVDPRVGFRPHQLLSHALLHDTSSLVAFIFHLGGNMLFLLVFGLRINELIGNVWTAILYPVFAACSGAAHLWMSREGDFGALLGASGAVFGLAGMYLVLFPVQRVRMLGFLNLWMFTAFMCLTKPFWIRGLWLLLLLFVWGDVVPVVLGWEDNTAHWAHLGGFVAGIVAALLLLFTRQVYARGDILSVALGRHAWWLVGRPSRLIKTAPAPAPAMPAGEPG
jgi:membrane associated rhomboid family serine protease